MKVKIVNKSTLPIPEYKTQNSSGVDLYANIEGEIVIKPLERKLIPTGIYVEIPEGYEGQIRARSGLALNHGITLTNGIGTVDSDYRGEIKVLLINLGKENYTIKRGDRIAQLVLIKYEKILFEEVEEIDETYRGTGGFGHTGK
ncbi:dUTP diphosphatase [Acidilutibacter cellobiosedens]|jgi:dUTP pyrophosphatase|uniref:Deoxyuridine 5'-triphosphate nucleotidohydrolase n=1 Tax=Acidilutibacter cellobiosedens TaxID=2507161 RepID=A0A410QCE4_9FIRM|nr:dUTP diphosphatase [Acidilutibacter cellobiosedens]QAT61661.1 dUTP diphosphatase [Acidilutibacter cellobiosedens]